MTKPRVLDYIKPAPEKVAYTVRVDAELLTSVKAEAERQGVTLTDLSEAMFLHWLAECGKSFHRDERKPRKPANE